MVGDWKVVCVGVGGEGERPANSMRLKGCLNAGVDSKSFDV